MYNVTEKQYQSPVNPVRSSKRSLYWETVKQTKCTGIIVVVLIYSENVWILYE